MRDADVGKLLGGLGEDRARTLQTRAVLVLPIPEQPSRQHALFRWRGTPPDFTRNDLRFYTDGSVALPRRREVAAAACALVVCSSAGDLLAVRSAGAYGFVMSSNYNTRNRPPELMVDGEQVHIVRRRETLEEQLGPESCLPE